LCLRIHVRYDREIETVHPLPSVLHPASKDSDQGILTQFKWRPLLSLSLISRRCHGPDGCSGPAIGSNGSPVSSTQPLKYWEEIRESRAAVYDFMGAALAMTYKQPPTDRDRDHNVPLAWGVPVPAWTEDFERQFGHALYELYGSVEAAMPVVQQGKRVTGSCGKILPGYTLRIVNDV